MKFFKKVTFFNYYLGCNDEIEFTWTIEEGFNSVEEAISMIKQLGLNPNIFAFIKFKNMFFPVTIETTMRQILISKEYIWIVNMKHSPWPSGVYDPLTKYNIKNDTYEIPTITKPRISSEWTNTQMKDMESFDKDFAIVNEFKDNKLNIDCKILFGIAMFDTDIPVYKLNSVDKYYMNSPSTWRLWESGIEFYNPFSDKRIYRKKGKVYSLRQWAKENNIKNYNTNCKAAKY